MSLKSRPVTPSSGRPPSPASPPAGFLSAWPQPRLSVLSPPINWALERGDVELARLLEEHGASEGTTFAHKLRQMRKSLASAAIVAALLFGGSM